MFQVKRLDPQIISPHKPHTTHHTILIAMDFVATIVSIRAKSPHPIPQGFFSLLLKPYIKGVTHFQEVGWWNVQPFFDFLVQYNLFLAI